MRNKENTLSASVSGQVLQRHPKQILFHVERSDENTVAVKKSDRAARALFAEIPPEIFFAIVAFLDVNTITMGLSVISYHTIQVLEEAAYPYKGFFDFHFLRFQSTFRNIPLPTIHTDSSKPISHKKILKKKKRFHSYHSFVNLSCGDVFLHNATIMKKELTFFTSQLNNSNMNCYQLRNTRFPISSISASNGCEKIILGAMGGDLEIFDYRGNRQLYFNWGDLAILAAEIDQDGKLLAIGSFDSKQFSDFAGYDSEDDSDDQTSMIRLVDAISGNIITEIKGLPGDVMRLAFNHDASLLAAAFEDELRVFCISANKIVQCYVTSEFSYESPFEFSPCGRLFVFHDDGNCLIKVVSTHDWKPFTEMPYERRLGLSITAITFNARSDLIALAFNVISDNERSIMIWNVNDGHCEIYQDENHENIIHAIGFSADDKKIMRISYHHNFKYIYETEREQKRPEVHNTGILTILDRETKECVTKEISRDRLISACKILDDHIVVGHTDGSLEHYRFAPMVEKIEQVEVFRESTALHR